ncbi:DUF6113 family protein [Streptomyces yunnanensis]|uniref:Integral membrane protein n=1 Tax=Streptomyces yunnanensis TaxID=156453 RepID=A0A9X8MPD6_9ACTN|nr:DUF6113 family protein [Streptomyces yunnanensis]SHL25166.1 hypothetical protein SAMN05216268_103361 [Streptomyces yunnanensis]
MTTSKGGGAADKGGARNGGDAEKANKANEADNGRRTRASGSGPAAARGGGTPAAPASRPVPGAPLTPGRVGVYVLLLVAGVLLAFAGTLLQAAWFPGGLLLALAGMVGLFYGGSRATGTVGGVLVPGAAWLVTVFLLLSDVRPEGDFLFGPGIGSYAFLLGGIVIAVICATGSQVRATGVSPGRVGG